MDTTRKKALGIIGGMGPMATVELFRMIVENTKSTTDQGHIHIYIDNNPQIPDRTKAILGEGESPVSALVESGKKLQRMGAELLLIPCNTSHYFLNEIQNRIDVNILNMIWETYKVVNEKGYKKVGLLATDGTQRARIYHDVFEDNGIEIVSPDNHGQKKIMELIYSGVKSGNSNFDTLPFMEVVNNLFALGAQTMVLGCTEIPVGMRMYNLSFNHVDAMKSLAKAAIVNAGYELVEFL